MQGGFNTLDNMLFRAEDFENTGNPKLFARLYSLNQNTLHFYLNNLKKFCNGSIDKIIPPALYDENQLHEPIPENHKKYVPNPSFQASAGIGHFQIISNDDAVVLSSTFQKLGNTPLELPKDKFMGKTVVVSNGKKTRQILLASHKKIIQLNFT